MKNIYIFLLNVLLLLILIAQPSDTMNYT